MFQYSIGKQDLVKAATCAERNPYEASQNRGWNPWSRFLRQRKSWILLENDRWWARRFGNRNFYYKCWCFSIGKLRVAHNKGDIGPNWRQCLPIRHAGHHLLKINAKKRKAMFIGVCELNCWLPTASRPDHVRCHKRFCHKLRTGHRLREFRSISRNDMLLSSQHTNKHDRQVFKAGQKIQRARPLHLPYHSRLQPFQRDRQALEQILWLPVAGSLESCFELWPYNGDEIRFSWNNALNNYESLSGI